MTRGSRRLTSHGTASVPAHDGNPDLTQFALIVETQSSTGDSSTSPLQLAADPELRGFVAALPEWKALAPVTGSVYNTGIHVKVGDSGAAGQHIGDIGSPGKSTGPHLHLEIHPGGEGQPAVDALNWLTEHGAAGIGDAEVALAGCRP